MTRLRWLEAITIVGLTIACLGLASKVLTSGSQSSSDDDPGRLEVTSIDLSTAARTAIFAANGMAPGDSVNAAFTIANPGRQPMTYAMVHGSVSAAGIPLSAALVLTIKTVGSSCQDFDGTTLYEGPLSAAAFGSATNGRLLPAATAEILCFRAVLPLDAGNELQGAATTVSLSFDARLQGAAR